MRLSCNAAILDSELFPTCVAMVDLPGFNAALYISLAPRASISVQLCCCSSGLGRTLRCLDLFGCGGLLLP